VTEFRDVTFDSREKPWSQLASDIEVVIKFSLQNGHDPLEKNLHAYLTSSPKPPNRPMNRTRSIEFYSSNGFTVTCDLHPMTVNHSNNTE